MVPVLVLVVINVVTNGTSLVTTTAELLCVVYNSTSLRNVMNALNLLSSTLFVN